MIRSEVKGRRGRAIDRVWAHNMVLLRGGDNLSSGAAPRLEQVFTLDGLTGIIRAVWMVGEQLRVLLRTGSMEGAAAAKEVLEELEKAAARPEPNRLYCTFCRWWKGIEVLIVTGAITGKLEGDNPAIRTSNRPPAATAMRPTTKPLSP